MRLTLWLVEMLLATIAGVAAVWASVQNGAEASAVTSTDTTANSSNLRKLGLDTDTAFKSLIPMAASGSCEAGTVYTIESIQDLSDQGADLECIFAAGKAPRNVPLGFGYGFVLSVANTGFWSPLMQVPYQGDYVVKTHINNQFYNIGWLSILGMDVGTAVWSIGRLGWDLAPGEYPEGDTDSILMDFTVDFDTLCQPEGNESPIGLFGFCPFHKSIFPISTFRDLGRVVGYDTDGGVLTLNKAFIYSEGLGAHSALIYAMKSFDPALPPLGFVSGSTIEVPLGPNGETTIEYTREGAEGLVNRVLGILFNPLQLTREVAKREAERQEMIAEQLKHLSS